MKQAAIVLVLFGVLMTASLGAWADSGNPFGFDTKTHPRTYAYCKQNQDKDLWFEHYGYICTSAPRPHPDFRTYVLVFIEPSGLCEMTAFSDPQKELALVERYRVQIAGKYGPPTSSSRVAENNLVYSWSSGEGFQGVGPIADIKFTIIQHGIFIRTSVHGVVRFWFRTSCQQALIDQADRAF